MAGLHLKVGEVGGDIEMDGKNISSRKGSFTTIDEPGREVHVVEVKDETADVEEVGGGVEKIMSSRKEGDERETFTEQRLDMEVTCR